MARNLEAQFSRFVDRNDMRALGRVFDATAPDLLRVARHLCPDESTAEDAVSASYLEAIETAHRYDRERPLLPWLLGILANRVRTRRRSELRRRQREGQTMREVEDPSDVVARRELDALCSTKTAALPEPYRGVLLLTLEHGLTPKQIGEVLQRRPATVRTQIARGMELLRRSLPAGVAGGVLVATLSSSSLRAIRSRVVGTTRRVAPLAVTGVVAAVAYLSVVFSSPVDPGNELLAEPIFGSAGASFTTLAATTADSNSVRLRPRQQEPKRARVTVKLTWPDGAPASGRWIRLWPFGRPNPFLRRRNAVTDERGICVFRDLDPCLSNIYTHGYGTSQRLDLEKKPEQVVELRLKRSGFVEGTVVDQNGEPVDGVTILLGESGGAARLFPAAKTDARGRYRVRMSGVQPIAACKPGYIGSWTYRAERQPEGHQPLRLDLELGGSAARIDGRVTDRHGKPLAGARVLVGHERFRTLSAVVAKKPGFWARSRPPLRLRTDSEGRFVARGLAPAPETQLVAVRADGFAPWSNRVKLAKAGRAELPVQLERGATVVGRVTDVGGKPVAGAVVMNGGYGAFLSAQSRTDHDGRFTIGSLPVGDVRLKASHEDHGRLAKTLQLDHRTTTWNPVLGTDVALFGRVVDATGKGLAKWCVEAWYPIDALNERCLFGKTNEKGLFRIPDAGERVYRVTVRGPRAMQFSSERRGVRARVSPLSFRVSKRAMPTAGLRAEILDESGKPLTAHVMIERVGHPARRGVPLLDVVKGRLSTTGWLPGDYEVRVRIDDRRSWSLGRHTLRPDGMLDLGTLRSPKRSKLRLKIVDGRDVRAASHVNVRDAHGIEVYQWFDRDNGAQEPDLAPGRYLVSARVDRTVVCRTLEVGATTASLRIDLADGTEHEVKVEGERGSALEMTSCELIDRTGKLRFRAMIGRDQWINVPAFSGTVRLTSTDGRRGEAPIRTGPGAPEQIRVQLR